MFRLDVRIEFILNEDLNLKVEVIHPLVKTMFVSMLGNQNHFSERYFIS